MENIITLFQKIAKTEKASMVPFLGSTTDAFDLIQGPSSPF